MQTITTVGLDIAKSAFQVHGIDAAGQVVIRRRRIRSGCCALAHERPRRRRAAQKRVLACSCNFLQTTWGNNMPPAC